MKNNDGNESGDVVLCEEISNLEITEPIDAEEIISENGLVESGTIGDLSFIPQEILMMILGFCDPRSLEMFRTTCHGAYNIGSDINLWSSMAQRNFGCDLFNDMWKVIVPYRAPDVSGKEVLEEITTQEITEPGDAIMKLYQFKDELDGGDMNMCASLCDLMCSTVVGLYRFIEKRHTWEGQCVYRFTRGINRGMQCNRPTRYFSPYCDICCKKKVVQVSINDARRAPPPVQQSQIAPPQLQVRLYDEAKSLFHEVTHNFILRSEGPTRIVVTGRLSDSGEIVHLTESEKEVARSLQLEISE